MLVPDRHFHVVNMQTSIATRYKSPFEIQKDWQIYSIFIFGYITSNTYVFAYNTCKFTYVLYINIKIEFRAFRNDTGDIRFEKL